jgi:transcriptional regulator with XRE-family HTH domain
MLGCATNQTGRPQGTRRFSHATKGEICDMNARSINQWLREERKRVGMTQAQVAGAAGMSRGYYNSIENGTQRPTFETWKQLARVIEPGANDSDLMSSWLASGKAVEVQDEAEEMLLKAFRAGDVTTMLKLIETRAA